jgi:hypothetical protein
MLSFYGGRGCVWALGMQFLGKLKNHFFLEMKRETERRNTN